MQGSFFFNGMNGREEKVQVSRKTLNVSEVICWKSESESQQRKEGGGGGGDEGPPAFDDFFNDTSLPGS